MPCSASQILRVLLRCRWQDDVLQQEVDKHIVVPQKLVQNLQQLTRQVLIIAMFIAMIRSYSRRRMERNCLTSALSSTYRQKLALWVNEKKANLTTVHVTSEAHLNLSRARQVHLLDAVDAGHLIFFFFVHNVSLTCVHYSPAAPSINLSMNNTGIAHLYRDFLCKDSC